jgi:hypothetical protein
MLNPDQAPVNAVPRTLDDLAHQQQWVGWREEERKSKKIKLHTILDTTVSAQQRILTWGLLLKQKHALTNLMTDAPIGVGIVLGDLGNGYHLVGDARDPYISGTEVRRLELVLVQGR